MGHLGKNPELRREIGSCLLLTLLLGAAGLLAGPATALALLGAGVLFTGLHLAQAAKRYRAMEEMGAEIDRVLHGQEKVLITRQAEGELSILRSEVEKLTVRLAEQADALRREKAGMVRAMEDIFHQVRTPLTSLNLQIALLAKEDLPWEKRRQLTREARRQLQRLDWLTEALLKMSRIDAGVVTFHREPVSLRKLTEKAAAPLSIPMELREQTLSVSVGEETFLGDLSWSVEALGNLLKNCMEHTPPGGTISVTGEETALWTQLTVQDTGPGFAPEDLPHLFERFYRGRNAGAESVGIGLALARMIAAEQNGTLMAGNAPEGGARFVLRFYKSVV